MNKRHSVCKIFFLTIIFLTALLLLPGFHDYAWGQIQSQTFATSGSFTVPTGVTSITVECWGGGGAGGGSTSNNSGGSGGGGGGYTNGTLTVTSGQIITYTVGTGGTGSTGDGNSGTATTFSTLTANGGTGGGSNKGTAGVGGSGSGGTTITKGDDGNKGNTSGGDGGAGANGGAGGTGTTNSDGNVGTAPGGGGGGGERGGGTSYSGGAGGAGQITVTWISPGIWISLSSLDFGTVSKGGTSANSTYTLSGNSLSPTAGNITITAPSNFEVSTSSTSGFASSITVAYTGGALAATTIYVRFKPTAVNTSYSGTITNSGGGSTTQNVAVTGNSNLSYCSSYGNTSYNTSVTLLSFNTINNVSANSTYSDYTSISTDVIKGNSYNLSVNLNTDGNYIVYSMVWIDWNQDGDFDDTGESYDLGSASNKSNGATSSSPYAITIPTGAVTGITRMRVSCKYSSSPTSCGTNFDGEVEDYSLNVIPAVTTYYSSGSKDATSVNNWGLNIDGSGAHPANFTSNNQKFVIQSGSTYTTSSTWTVSGTNSSIEIQSGGKLVVASGNEIKGTASFSLLSGGTLEIGNAAGITSSGATGSIQCSGTRSFDSGANYIYSGSAAQVTGSGLPTTVNYLTINNSAGVSLSGSETINGTLTLTSGTFTVGANTLTLNGAAIAGTPAKLATTSSSSLVFGGTASGVNIPSSVTQLNNLTINNSNGVTQNSSITLSGNPALTLTSGILIAGTNSIRITNTGTDAVSAGSSTSYVSGGSISRVLNNSGTNIYFPVGNSSCGGIHQFTLNNPTITNGSELKVTYACTGVGAPDMVTLSSLPFTYNWKLELVSGSFISTDIKLESSDIALTHNIGACTTQGGSYASLDNSTPASGSLTATGVTVLPKYFTPANALRKTYYSYQAGNWNVANTWTIDPSGTLSIGASVPTATDNVVILNGRTVNSTTNNITCISLDIKNGGILNLGSTTGHSFETLSGQGIIKTQSVLPTVTNFNFNQSGGGTVEYNNPSSFTFVTTVYNNLIINLSTSAFVATLTDDMTIYGNITVQQGILQINNNSSNSRTININGNVAVKSSGRIQLGTGDANHRFIVKGDFTNEGTVRFTNQTSPAYTSTPNNGRADVVFNNATANQNLVCNGLSDFYRIEIDKGIDQTYILNIDANSTSNFNLYGENDLQTSPPSTDTPNVPNANALGLLAGTVRLGSNIVLPCLSSAVYNIDLDAQIWIDGASVTFTSGTSSSSIVIYGKLRVSNSGTLIANGYQGIVMREQSAFYMESGTVTTDCIRTSAISGTHRGAFVMSGGTINISGNTNFSGTGMYASFTLPYPDNVFRMSGGTININSPTTTSGNGQYFSILFGSDAKNAQLTGGTINVTVLTTGWYPKTYINSTIPFWDLNIISSSSSYSAQIYDYAGNSNPVIPVIAAQPLTVLHDLSIQNSGVFKANGNNVTVGHDFTIASTATYTPGSNLTTFNGTSLQTFSNLGTITSGLYNLAVTQTSNTGIGKDLIVRGTCLVDQDASFNDNGFYTTVAGNITNSGTCLGQPAGGGIRLNGTSMQQIYGDGTGVFNHLIIDNTSDATTNCNISLTGNLRLISNSFLDIGGNSLSMSANSNIYDGLTGTTQTGFASSKMVKSSGLQSDGGIIKQFGGLTSFLYPIGTGSLYTPVTTQFFTAPTTWGKIQIRPVNMRHPLAQGSTNALNYYWQLDTLGFAGVAANSVTHTFNYSSLTPVPGTESSYLPAYYDSQWNTLSAAYMNTVSHTAGFDRAAMNLTPGSYTVGMASAFSGLKTYYSRSAAPNIGTTGANWNTVSTWSSDAVLKWNGAQDGSIPGANSVVIIGDGTVSHLVNISANAAKAGNLVIATNSTLDIASTTGHNFGSIPNSKVSGKGTLRLSSATFPQGDWDVFLSSGGGTVEYYTPSTAASLSLPSSYTSPSGSTVSFTNYNNLILTPTSGYYIAMPSGASVSNLNVYGNFTAQGTGFSQFNRTSNTQNLIVSGDVTVKSGATLQYYSSTAQNVTVGGNISNSGTFSIGNIGTATNSLTVSGNLVNNGSFDMLPGTGQSGNVTFKNVANTQVSGTTATRTRFNSITVDKGTNRNSILDVTVNNTNFSLNTALSNAITLTNGTFRLSNGANLTLSTNSDYTIPTTGCISVNNGTVNFSNITGTSTTSYDLLLNGRLEVLGTGIVNVGNSTNTIDYDIEYSSGGNPEIFVLDQGTLNVYGQIRRPILITTGALSYSQSGTSNVTVFGQNANSAKGMFEILNTGSSFSMSGGTLTLARCFSGTTNDVYINPTSYSVTVGTIQFGRSGVTTAGSNYYFAISSPVGTLSVGASGLDVTANQQIFELTTVNDLVINSSASVYKANGINVTIGRDILNNNTTATAGIGYGGYLTGSSSQKTTFNGIGAQKISGTSSPRNLTNFSNVLINKSGTLSLNSGNSNIRINGDLTISTGKLEDNGNVISLSGNVTNNSEHSSSTSGGGLSFVGSSKQTIYGNGAGVFGNIIINNGNGIDMTASSTINGLLNFNIDSGYLYIDDYLLSLGQSASFSGYNSLRYIRLNGALSDLGVKKYFNTGSQPAFVFPIGVVNKYTPATYTIAANSASGTSSIKVKPVNTKHPSTYELPIAVTDELQYYWNVASTGFVSPSITHTYKYLNSDALPNETGYVVGRFDNSNLTVPTWSIPTGSSVNASSDLITISNTSLIDGEYTCGVNSNFVSLPTYYSRNAASNISTTGANWNSTTSWTLSSDGSGAAVSDLPSGNTMVILSGHRINMDVNSSKAYAVNIYGILDVGTTLYHSLGHISGTGRIRIAANAAPNNTYVFPGGYYDNFMGTSGTVIEFYGTNDATLPLKPGNYSKPYQNVEFSDNSHKYVSAENMKVLGNLTINANGGYLDNSLYNKDIQVLGNWIDSKSTVGFVPGTGTVTFAGSSAQGINITSNFAEPFYNLGINNSSTGVTLSGLGRVEVSNNLVLTNGVFTANSTNTLSLTNTSTSVVTGGSSSSFVNGPLRKNISSGSYFNFPVGDASTRNRYGNVVLLSTATSGSQYWTAQYYDSGYSDVTNKVDPISSVSSNEYWRVNGVSGATANVRLRWDSYSDLISSEYSLRQKLRVAEYITPALPKGWTMQGQYVNDPNQTVESTTSFTLGNDHYVTLAITSVPTVKVTSSTTASFCNDDGVATISLLFTDATYAPFSYAYTIDGGSEQIVTGAPSVATLQLNAAALGGVGVHTVALTKVWDNTNTLGITRSPNQVVITVNANPATGITGPTTAGTSTTQSYSTTADANTYTWSLSGGGTITGTGSTRSINWTTAGSYTLQVTKVITATGCSSISTVNISVSSTPSPVISGNIVSCIGTSEIYQVTNNSGNTYSWKVDGLSVTGSTNSISVSFSTSGSHTVSVKECNGSNCTTTLDYSVNVGAIPLDRTVIAPTSTCSGSPVAFTIQNTEATVTYQLVNSSNVNVGLAVAGTGGDISLPVSPTSTTSYYINAIQQAPYNCIKILNNSNYTVTVNTLPVAPTAASNQSFCGNSTIASLVATAPSGSVVEWFNTSSGGVALSSGTVLSSGTYYAQSKSSTTGCLSATRTAVVAVVYANLTASISGGTTPICFNTAPGTFTATGTGGTGTYTYRWYTTSGIISGATSATYTPGNITTTTGYYCAITSGTCGTVNTATTTITVTANMTASAASATPTLCINTALTPITHATTLATGIGIATGLPAGVTAAWASNVITISGTPTASGTFNYSIPLTGGCGTVNATGTIVVDPLIHTNKITRL